MQTLSVAEFCRQHGISRGLFYNLLREGRAPRVMKVGRRTLISYEAAEEWRRKLELPAQPRKTVEASRRRSTSDPGSTTKIGEAA
jgi:excisionase family DNA binding protein